MKRFFRFKFFTPLKVKFLFPILFICLFACIILGAYFRYLYQHQLKGHALVRAQELGHFLGMCSQLVHYPYELQRIVYALSSEPHVKFVAVLSGNPLKILACNRKTLIGNLWKEYPVPKGIRLPNFPHSVEIYDYLSHRNIFNYVLGCYLAQYSDRTEYIPAYIVIQLHTQYWHKEFLQQSVRTIGIVGGIFLLLILGCWLQINRLILKPLNAITRQMNKRRFGNKLALAPTFSDDEIGHLSHTLNEMISAQEKSENLFQHLADTAPVLLWTSNYDNTRFHFSKRWAEFTGQTRIKYDDWSWLYYLSADDAAAYRKAFLEAQKDKKPFAMECRIRSNSGEYRDMWSHCVPRFLSNGTFEGYLCCLMDISERKESERKLQKYAEELAKARDTALQSVHAKSLFLATMSHEIRTPINGILGFTYLLNETQLNEEQKDYLASIHSSTQLLLDLINQILDLSKIEADKLVLEPVVFSWNDCLSTVVELFKPTLQKKGLSLNIWQSPRLPQYFFGDNKRLRQILMNLLSNAIKFTSQGSIYMRITGRNLSKKHYQLFVSVKDEGVGIQKQDQVRIFKAFEQVAYQNKGGTGLGLSITKSLIELMSGSLKLYSKPAQGSIFYFTVNLGLTHKKPLELPTNTHLSVMHDNINSIPRNAGKTILLVEDNVENQRVAQKILEQKGYQVVVAENGYRCLDWLQNNKPDLILMDVHMPEMDGYETTQRIRACECGLDKCGIPILGLTAHAVQETYDECLAIGMNELLTKPFRPNQLLETIDTLLAS